MGGGEKIGIYTEACHCYTGVVDYDVYPIWVLLLQEGSEVCDALRLGDVEAMVFNCCEAAVCGQGFGTLQLGVIMECFDGFFATASVAGGQVDE